MMRGDPLLMEAIEGASMLAGMFKKVPRLTWAPESVRSPIGPAPSMRERSLEQVDTFEAQEALHELATERVAKQLPAEAVQPVVNKQGIITAYEMNPSFVRPTEVDEAEEDYEEDFEDEDEDDYEDDDAPTEF
jgi:hypothetical protein